MHYLPRQAVPIVRPPVPLAEWIGIERHVRRPALREHLPQLVDFRLRPAQHEKRDRRGELEERASAGRHERLSEELERYDVSISRRGSCRVVTLVTRESGKVDE